VPQPSRLSPAIVSTLTAVTPSTGFADPSRKRAVRKAAPKATAAKVSIQQKPAPPKPAPAKPAKKAKPKDRLTEAKKSAEALEAKGNYRSAWTLYEQVLDMTPTVTSETQFALEGIGRLAHKAEKYGIAADYWQRVVQLDATSTNAAIQLGHVMYDWGEYTKALECFKVALNNATVLKKPQAELDYLKVQLAKVLYHNGDQDSGIAVLTQVLGDEMENECALHEYGIACLDRDKPEDALKIYLRLLVADPENKTLRGLLTRAVQGAGVAAVTEEIAADNPASAPALAFLALVVKDSSAIEEAVTLYRLSLKLMPTSVSYALNLVHTLEVTCRYTEAMQQLREFCEANPGMKVGQLSCRDFLAAAPEAFTALEGPQAEHSPLDAASGVSLGERAAQVCPSLDKSAQAILEGALGKPKHPYNEQELDLLALFYTAVKILFVSGHTEHILRLAEKIEPIRGSYELHLTTIRNENAYYCCVVQLLICPGLYDKPAGKPLYVVGDSHSLSPSWRSIQVKGEDRLLLGRLVTGLKMWHLRPESRFFPKANFEAAMAQVPDGSECMFIFGEIDCREGLLVCVEKCRYEDIEEGAQVTIKIYLDNLKKLIVKKGLTIYVHPVNPVIKETRHIVKIFNTILKKTLAKYAKELPEGKLVWLDFFDELLEGPELRPEFNLDGTHIHPNYLKVVEAAFNKL